MNRVDWLASHADCYMKYGTLGLDPCPITPGTISENGCKMILITYKDGLLKFSGYFPDTVIDIFRKPKENHGTESSVCDTK